MYLCSLNLSDRDVFLAGNIREGCFDGARVLVVASGFGNPCGSFLDFCGGVLERFQMAGGLAQAGIWIGIVFWFIRLRTSRSQ